ncbi:MAG: TatD family deoxyribonuclease [Alphaproteobacteria bacterium]|nr:TatD family deoxyribonuclease [Alphaproteobacteria bacterium]
MLVDSHCHLDFPDFEGEVDRLVERAEEAGVGCMVTICTRPRQAEAAVALAERHDSVFCAIGLHPHHVAAEGMPEEGDLVALARHPKVVGLGETGLDYHYDRSPRELQQESFRRHIRAAAKAGLPFIVHSRNADADTASILEEEAAGQVPGVMHCFSSGRTLADKALELGLYISLSGIVTFRNSTVLREIAADVPLDRLLVETDAPFLAPVPMRGKRNEPAFVVHTAAATAELKGVSSEAFAAASTDNFFRLFRKAQTCG